MCLSYYERSIHLIDPDKFHHKSVKISATRRLVFSARSYWSRNGFTDWTTPQIRAHRRILGFRRPREWPAKHVHYRTFRPSKSGNTADSSRHRNDYRQIGNVKFSYTLRS